MISGQMGMDKVLLRQLVCPYSGAPLIWREEQQELWCLASKLAYPIVEGIPLMIIEKARTLTDTECDTQR